MTDAFFDRLEARVAATGSLLCVGLDPRVGSAADARRFCRRIVEATLPHAAAFKPNAAFFEALGPAGGEVLVEVAESIPDEIPVLLDVKRGDIGATAAAYATAAFDRIGAGAVTLSPYLGADSISPFLAHPGSGVFVLCRTSNEGGSDFQEAILSSGEPVYLAVARAAAGWAGPLRLGLVVGATEPDAVARVRDAVPEHWILAPGVGAQGGSLEEAVGAGLREDGTGLLVPVSRLIAEASDPGAAAADLGEAVHRARANGGPRVGPIGSPLAVELFDAGCVRFGDFELKSGARSPIYIDLRTLAGRPELMRRVARHYVSMLRSEEGSVDHWSSPAGTGTIRLAGVPLAGVPIATAVSLESGMPMVYPRPLTKDHGTRSAVEGPFEPGDRAVMIDDVATSGISVLEAAERVREAGLVVDAAVVLIDRGGGASDALESAGIELHSMLSLPGLVLTLHAAGRISSAEAARVGESLGL